MFNWNKITPEAQTGIVLCVLFMAALTTIFTMLALGMAP